MKKFFGLLALALLSPFATKAADASRPNIVFILVDDLRWDGLSCTGSKVAKTPNIDRIAKEGALFKNFFVTLPLCAPSRATFLTGEYADRHGVIDNADHNELSHKLVTFPKLLHDIGYETAYVGKLHMGNDDSPRPGFDRWVSFKGQGVYENPMINFDGKAERVPGYITDILNSNAVAFVKKERAKPFVLYLAHKAVHGPFTPAERDKNLYAGKSIPTPKSLRDPLNGKPAVTRELPTLRRGRQTGPPEPAERKTPTQLAIQQLRAMAAIDDGVGQLFRALEETKQLENTIFIFTSDNGYFWGEHGLSDKRWAYEESIRIPFLVRYPKLAKAGSVIDEMVLNCDLAPTMLELGGAKIPKQVQGESFLPLLKGNNSHWRDSALFEYFEEKQYRTPSWKAVRTEDWKYIHYTDLNGMDELYDLQNDPFEMKNLIDDPASEKQLKKFKADLARLEKKY